MDKQRRKLMGGAVGVAVVGIGGSISGISKAYAAPEDVAEAVKAFAGDAEVSSGPITLTAPEIAENGNSVPIGVKVDSPMTEDDHVVSVVILAEGNPNPEVATFNFSAASGEASASTRMRLAQTQNVVAVAKMSDGSVFSDTRNIKVTIGGCGG